MRKTEKELLIKDKAIEDAERRPILTHPTALGYTRWTMGVPQQNPSCFRVNAAGLQLSSDDTALSRLNLVPIHSYLLGLDPSGS